MPCERYRKTLVDVAAGGDVTAEIDAHLGSCLACRDELRALREALGLADAVLAAGASAEPSVALRVRIREAVEADAAPIRSAWQWLWPAPAAALLLVAVAAGGFRGARLARSTRVAAVAAPAASMTPALAVSGSRDVEREGATTGGVSASVPQAPRREQVEPSREVRSVLRPRQSARHADPEVLVPAGQEEALMHFVAFMERERIVPRALLTAGEPLSDLPEAAAIEIKPLEIVPLDAAETSGT